MVTKPSWEERKEKQECNQNREGLDLLSLM